MSEKMERRIKIGLNCFAVFAVILLIVTLWSHSQYTPNEHSMEQGHLPVYVTPPGQNGSDNGATTPSEEDFFENLDLTQYKYMSYNEVMTACSKLENKQIKVKGTIYSILETASSVIYSIADEDGNYYSVVDQSNGRLPKFKKQNIIIVYGVPHSMSKLNNNEIPQLKAAFFEQSY